MANLSRSTFLNSSASSTFDTLTSLTDDLCAIVNAEGRVLHLDSKLRKALNIENPNEYVGKRLGNIIKCSRVSDYNGECGSNRACDYCGANAAFKECLETQTLAKSNATLTIMHGDQRIANEFLVKVRPLANTAQSSQFLVALTDISSQKRNSLYEERLFTMLLSRLSGIYSACSSIAVFDPQTMAEIIMYMQSGLGEMLTQVQDCISLRRAETNTLEVCIWPLVVDDVIKSVLDRVAQQNHIYIKVDNRTSADTTVLADKDVLISALTELLKNAFEYRGSGIVNVRIFEQNNNIIFIVHNVTALDDQARYQVFQRSFTTKANQGRGLGTYMAKLYIEQILKGKISFKSTNSYGTAFIVSVPNGMQWSYSEQTRAIA